MDYCRRPVSTDKSLCPLRVIQRHVLTISISYGVDDFGSEVELCSRSFVHEVEHFMVSKSARCHTLDPSEDESRGMTLLSTIREHYCYTFSVLKGTKLTDWSTTGPII